MHILLATDTRHAADAYTLTRRMCEELNYPSQPEKDAFIEYVLFERTYLAIFVAYNANNEPVGQVILTRRLDPYMPGYFGEMQSLYVVPEARKSGIADKLVDALMAEAPKRGYKGVQWYVFRNNQASLTFFARRGMTPKEQPDFVEFVQPVITDQ